MANAIVIIATLGLSILPVKDLLFPPPPADQITNIRIGAGSNNFADGAIPGIHLFDFEGKTIGIEKSNGDRIGKGKDQTISVNHLQLNDDAAAQAEYISVVQGGNDAICISYITAILPNGVQYAWNGDVGFQCGALWTYGNTTLSADPAGGIYQPRCNWIDGDNSDGLHPKAIAIHMPSFLANQGRVDQYKNDNDVMCKANPRFKVYDELDVEDSIPHFKNTPFDLLTLLDFNRDQTLDPANWITTPVDRTPLQGIGKRHSSKYGNDNDQVSSQYSNSGPSCSNATASGYKDKIPGCAPNNNGNADEGGNNVTGNNNNGNADEGNNNVAGNNNNNKNKNKNKHNKAASTQPAVGAPHSAGNNTTTGNRQAPKQNEKHRGHLIKSGYEYHSAAELCGSSTSYGPDFVSIYEGIFCDMDQKRTYPLCKTAKQGACFDLVTDKMRLGAGNNRRDENGLLLPRKFYTSVEQW